MKTVMITGCSSGFGLETARYFLAQGWNVIATMRTPQEGLLPHSDRLRLLSLDVTSQQSIEQAVSDAGDIDVLVNNAGVGMLNALEGVSPEAVREIFETNTLGTLAMTRAVLPQFRQRRSGVIVNVTSAVTLKPLPLLAVYTASKAAVNAFTESLAIELAPFNIRVGLVLPGRSPATRFGENAQRIMGEIPAEYAAWSQQLFQGMQDARAKVTRPEDVAHAIWQMANDPDTPVRLPAGEDAREMAAQLM
ncbi:MULTISPECIES: SDR family oxidoreductase [unclassified Leclercia]|uniref:SDR family oxidoreductase n=1 Tax=unclassified Leclercia TaxID=2627398 RepID=UPI000DF466DE|nr:MULTISPECIES: SDR family oxidoreductase [unclassified Leclercia]AXF64636.1 SDR family NAD(P)-dependent oxidoreductase [Leclercia sp. W17]